MAQTPRIVYSPLTRSWFVVTRYTTKESDTGRKYLVAQVKHDVTDQMKDILSKKGRAAVRSGRVPKLEI